MIPTSVLSKLAEQLARQTKNMKAKWESEKDGQGGEKHIFKAKALSVVVESRPERLIGFMIASPDRQELYEHLSVSPGSPMWEQLAELQYEIARATREDLKDVFTELDELCSPKSRLWSL